MLKQTHVRSAITIKTDAGKAVGGLGENQNPVELLGNALAACALDHDGTTGRTCWM